ncbi:MAG: hypothetical protein ACRERC_23645, partial [Candidatus Binatia bacterium]
MRRSIDRLRFCHAPRSRRRRGGAPPLLAGGLGLLLLFATPVRAHDALSSLAAWGNFGAATPCMRVIS